MNLLLFILLILPKTISADLKIPYLQAALNWYPLVAQVREVKWCQEECIELQFRNSIGFWYVEDSRIVVIPDVPENLLLTLEHEYGHALGLGHSSSMDSIMKPGWEPPVALKPSEEDREDVLRIP